jgi:hypothetical protein
MGAFLTFPEYLSPFGGRLPGRYWERVPDASLVFLWCL